MFLTHTHTHKPTANTARFSPSKMQLTLHPHQPKDCKHSMFPEHQTPISSTKELKPSPLTLVPKQHSRMQPTDMEQQVI